MKHFDLRSHLVVSPAIKDSCTVVCHQLDELLEAIPVSFAIDRLKVKFMKKEAAMAVDKKIVHYRKLQDKWHKLIRAGSRGASDLEYDRARFYERIYGSNFVFPEGENQHVIIGTQEKGGYGYAVKVMHSPEERKSILGSATSPRDSSCYRLLYLGDYLPCEFWNTIHDLSKTKSEKYEIPPELVPLIFDFLELYGNDQVVSSEINQASAVYDGVPQASGISQFFANKAIEAINNRIDDLHNLLRKTLKQIDSGMEEAQPTEILISGNKKEIVISIGGKSIHFSERQKQGICVLASFRKEPKFSVVDFSKSYSNNYSKGEERKEFDTFIRRIAPKIPQLRFQSDGAHGRTLIGIIFNVSISDQALGAFIGHKPNKRGVSPPPAAHNFL